MKRIWNSLTRSNAFWSASLQTTNDFYARYEFGSSPYPCDVSGHESVDQYGICSRCGKHIPELDLDAKFAIHTADVEE